VFTPWIRVNIILIPPTDQVQDLEILKKSQCPQIQFQLNLNPNTELTYWFVLQQLDTSMKVPVNDFDGKVTYGQKRSTTGSAELQGHMKALLPAVKQLAELEKTAQSSYINLLYMKPFLTRT